MHEVEFDIATAAIELKCSLGLGVWQGFALRDDGLIGWQKVVADGLHECKCLVKVTLIIVVKEDAADATCFISVWQIEVVVTIVLERCIQVRAKWDARLLCSLVPVNCVFFVAIVRGQVKSATKPPDRVTIFGLCVEETHIHVGGRYMWVEWVAD